MPLVLCGVQTMSAIPALPLGHMRNCIQHFLSLTLFACYTSLGKEEQLHSLAPAQCSYALLKYLHLRHFLFEQDPVLLCPESLEVLNYCQKDLYDKVWF